MKQTGTKVNGFQLFYFLVRGLIYVKRGEQIAPRARICRTNNGAFVRLSCQHDRAGCTVIFGGAGIGLSLPVPSGHLTPAYRREG